MIFPYLLATREGQWFVHFKVLMVFGMCVTYKIQRVQKGLTCLENTACV